MNFNLISDIKTNGFIGFKTIKDLLSDNSSIPATKGIYFLLYLDNKLPEFLKVGSGPSLYKKKTDPNVSLQELKSEWVKDTIVVYIGKAGGKNKKGIETKETLRRRLRTYFSFGQGKDIGHYGGRYVWQLKNSHELVVCWKSTPGQEPRSIEDDFIQEFKCTYHGQRPFANLQD